MNRPWLLLFAALLSIPASQAEISDALSASPIHTGGEGLIIPNPASGQTDNFEALVDSLVQDDPLNVDACFAFKADKDCIDAGIDIDSPCEGAADCLEYVAPCEEATDVVACYNEVLCTAAPCGDFDLYDDIGTETVTGCEAHDADWFDNDVDASCEWECHGGDVSWVGVFGWEEPPSSPVAVVGNNYCGGAFCALVHACSGVGGGSGNATGSCTAVARSTGPGAVRIGVFVICQTVPLCSSGCQTGASYSAPDLVHLAGVLKPGDEVCMPDGQTLHCVVVAPTSLSILRPPSGPGWVMDCVDGSCAVNLLPQGP